VSFIIDLSPLSISQQDTVRSSSPPKQPSSVVKLGN